MKRSLGALGTRLSQWSAYGVEMASLVAGAVLRTLPYLHIFLCLPTSVRRFSANSRAHSSLTGRTAKHSDRRCASGVIDRLGAS